jgi:hypothetical protein
MDVHYRRARPDDIGVALSLGLLESDRLMVSSDTWRKLPDLLTRLLHQERILLCVIEGAKSDDFLFFGGSGFVDPAFLNSAIPIPLRTLLDLAFAAEISGKRAFLGVRQVAAANAKAELCLFNFFGAPRTFDPRNPTNQLSTMKIAETWNFFHSGFQTKEIWAEFSDPIRTGFMVATGLEIMRQHTLKSGQTLSRLRITREQALETPSAGHIKRCWLIDRISFLPDHNKSF